MNAEQALQKEKLSRLDLSAYVGIPSGTTVLQALGLMRHARVSTALVQDQKGRLRGIFTERDVLLKVADLPALWHHPLDQFMTPDPQTLFPDEPISTALRMMTQGHYRNVPVLDRAGNIAGNVSQQAIIRFLADRFPRAIYNLPPDPDLIPRTREGA
ncbi:MAG: CBS domain-containing protein [Candidatus Latescibacteria bacterium]|nr:CBS domain-containing protein [Candidatus Latescibacterota bacterium]